MYIRICCDNMQLSVVTGNKEKFDEIALVLAEFGIDAAMAKAELMEEGATLEERVTSKAQHAFSLFQKPLIVDDTGIFFEACNGFPGALAKQIFYEIGYTGLFARLRGKSRHAHFRTLVCYVDAHGERLFEGTWHGRIATRVDGTDTRSQLMYERIFIPEGSEKTVSWLTLEEKILHSHRAQAVRRFCEFFVDGGAKRAR